MSIEPQAFAARDLTANPQVANMTADAVTAGDWDFLIQVGDGTGGGDDPEKAASMLSYRVSVNGAVAGGQPQNRNKAAYAVDTPVFERTNPVYVADGETLTIDLESDNPNDTAVKVAVVPRWMGAISAAATSNLEDAFDGTGYSFLYQQMAREAYGCSGTVYHIKYAEAEDLTKDGLSWETAKETAGVGVKTVIEAASFGDLVLIGAGTFALGNNSIIPLDGVSIAGKGLDVTVITSIGAFDPGGVGLILRWASYAEVRDLTLQGLNPAGPQMMFGADPPSHKFVNARARRLHIIGDTTGLYVGSDSEGCEGHLEDCWIEAKAYAVSMEHSDDNITLSRCKISCHGPSEWEEFGYNLLVRGVHVTAGQLYIIDCDVDISGGVDTSIGVENSGGTVHISGGTVGADVNSLFCSGGTITAVGVEYDRSKISETGTGSIVDIARVATDANGHTTDINSAVMRGTNGANTTTPPAPSAIAGAVWEEAYADHNTPGTYGILIGAAFEEV